MNEIYVMKEGTQYGPYTQEALLERVNTGNVGVNDLAWYDGMEEWHSVRSVLGLAPAPQPPAARLPPLPPHAMVPPAPQIIFIERKAKPGFVERELGGCLRVFYFLVFGFLALVLLGFLLNLCHSSP